MEFPYLVYTVRAACLKNQTDLFGGKTTAHAELILCITPA